MVARGKHRTISGQNRPFHAVALGRVVVAFALALAFVPLVAPSEASAEVRKADIVAGASVGDRGLSVAECPSIDAEFAVLMDSDGNVLFSRSGDDPSQIASITKVMTAIVAIDNAPEGLHVGVSEAAALVGESSAGLQEGDVMDFDAALKALLVPSGNDAAIALAEAVGSSMIASNPDLGGDPMEVFVAAMNAKAAEIGCTDTVYENPHGLDDDEYAGDLHSTAHDQALVARCAMSYPEIREIVSGGSTTIQVTRAGAKEYIDLETTDQLLDMYDKAIGIKTGLTLLAGPSFMGAANDEGREFYSVVLGASDEYQRFVDTQTMFEWGYEHVTELKLANSEKYVAMGHGADAREVPVIAEVAHLDWPDKTVPATMADPSAVITIFDLEGNVSQSVELDELHGNVRAGTKVGTITFKQHNQVIAQQDLIACQDQPAPNPIEGLVLWWQGVTGGANTSDAASNSEVYNVMPILDNNVLSNT
ncbi:MAG: D-alanyl-D-alanine carboxypeptidase [Eggerthellaceae bacterium]|nr:D-alanyl-D-alanine carboxypeptidase [Eggerthellaceae bacterium]